MLGNQKKPILVSQLITSACLFSVAVVIELFVVFYWLDHEYYLGSLLLLFMICISNLLNIIQVWITLDRLNYVGYILVFICGLLGFIPWYFVFSFLCDCWSTDKYTKETKKKNRRNKKYGNPDQRTPIIMSLKSSTSSNKSRQDNNNNNNSNSLEKLRNENYGSAKEMKQQDSNSNSNDNNNNNNNSMNDEDRISDIKMNENFKILFLNVFKVQTFCHILPSISLQLLTILFVLLDKNGGFLTYTFGDSNNNNKKSDKILNNVFGNNMESFIVTCYVLLSIIYCVLSVIETKFDFNFNFNSINSSNSSNNNLNDNKNVVSNNRLKQWKDLIKYYIIEIIFIQFDMLIRSLPLFLLFLTNIAFIYLFFIFQCIWSFEAIFFHLIYQLRFDFPLKLNNFSKKNSNSRNSRSSRSSRIKNNNKKKSSHKSSKGNNELALEVEEIETKYNDDDIDIDIDIGVGVGGDLLSTPPRHLRTFRGDRESMTSEEILSNQMTSQKEKQSVVFEKISSKYDPNKNISFTHNECIAGLNCLIVGTISCICGIFICQSLQNCHSKKEFVYCIIGLLIRYIISIVLVIIDQVESSNDINFKIWFYIFGCSFIFVIPYIYLSFVYSGVATKINKHGNNNNSDNYALLDG